MMYLQLTKSKHLITTDEIIHQVGNANQIDPKVFLNNIIIAETRVAKFLCYDFYEELVNQKNKKVDSSNLAYYQGLFPSLSIQIGDYINDVNFLSADNKELWINGWLWKYIAECVMWYSIPNNFAKFETQGLLHHEPNIIGRESANSVTTDLKTAQWINDRTNDRIDQLEGYIQNWICKRKDKYPLYCNCKNDACVGTNGNNAIDYSSRIASVITSAYEQIDKQNKSCKCKKKCNCQYEH